MTGFVKISNGDVVTVAHADGLAAGMDHSHSNYSVTGHTHDDRYFTENEVNTALAKKSDTGHTHNYLPLAGGKMDNTTVVTNLNADLLDGKNASAFATSDHNHDSVYYKITAAETALAKKSDTGHTHNIIGDGGMKVYSHNSNEVNFGGTSSSSTIYFGYRTMDEKPIPSSFVFGSSAGTATLKAGTFKKTDGTEVSYNGHTHDDRYLTETEVNTVLAKKSDTGHTHSQYSGTGHTHDDRYSLTGHTHPYAASAHTHDDRYFTEAEVNSALAKKSDTGHTHSAATTAVTGFVKISNGDVATVAHADGLAAGMDHSHSNYSVTGHTHDDRYFTETEINTALTKKSDTGHTHDDRYFTETEVNNLLAGKSDTGHTHSNYSPTGHTHDDRYFTEAEVNSALAKKSDTGHTHSNYSTTGHTHNYAGSSSAGGAATSAAKLTNTTAIGGSTQPVYFNASGVPVACTAYSGASVNYATSAGSANAVAWSNVSGKPYNATTAATGFVKISNGDVASVAHADGLAAGMDHSHGNYSTTAHTHSNYSTTSHTHTFITYSDGMNTGTTVSSIPITKRMYKATVSASGSFSIATGLTAGREVHVIIYNSGSSAITITMPTASTYVNMGDDSITIAAGGYAEVNALSDGSKIYIRNGW